MPSPIASVPANNDVLNLVNEPAGKLVNFDPAIHHWESAATQERIIRSLIYDHEKKTMKVNLSFWCYLTD